MKKVLFTLDDETLSLLEGDPNKSETIRRAIKLYKQHIPTEGLEGFRQTYAIIAKHLKEIDQKVDYLTNKL